MANTSKGKVCVTGASGFVASWLVKRLLESGYHVLGTVRDPGNQKKVAHLWNLAGAKERLELKEEMLDSAINGTLNVLRSCKKNPFLKRVVLTSSSSTVRLRDEAEFPPNVLLDETSWSSVEFCESIQIWYAVAKILAEKSAWEFAKENNIDLVAVLPTFVIGPNLSPVLGPTASDVLGLFKGDASLKLCRYPLHDTLNKVLNLNHAAGETEKFTIFGRMGYVHIDDVASCHILVYETAGAKGRYICNSAGETEKFTIFGRMGYVHIDDVASCHILVYETAGAKGRYICNSAVLGSAELVALLAKRFPSFPIPKSLPNIHGEQTYGYNTSKIRKLGLEFRGVEEMFDDSVESLKAHGYLREGAA
uniref:Bifunctional dihydroflavonol 4-reductase/flavanone 4-reductase n=1 Tax=Aegilops tauschii TaxID=37682 RepID=M8CLD8_AEGTA